MRKFILLLLVIMTASLMFAQELASLEVTPGPTTKGVSHWSVKVTLTAPAPIGGIAVTLAADPESSSTVPAEIKVPEGQLEASANAGRNPLADGGMIYANYGVTKSAPLAIPPPPNYDATIAKIVERERLFVATMKTLHPLVETYIQNLRESKAHDVAPDFDVYFLSRMNFNAQGYAESVQFDQKAAKAKKLGFLSGAVSHIPNPMSLLVGRQFIPSGFAQMVLIDSDMKADHYWFKYVRTEFVGEIRTMVFDVTPRAGMKGLFVGRIWVEDKNDAIIRFNGTYSTNGSRTGVYFHFDSWRQNVQPGLWLPTYVYSEESNGTKTLEPPYHQYAFKAQTRLWGYDVDPSKHNTEMTAVKVETADVTDTQAVKDYSPLESSRMWQKTAEDNAIDHLQKIGLLAPAGDVDKVLQTVVNNLIATNNLDIPEVRCRVLLTTPIESFTIGNTIVVSRGELDVLPDENALAAMLAHELAHIALGHRIDTKLAFDDRYFFADERTFRALSFSRNSLDEAAADKKAEELLASSPYKDKLGNAGLFLNALQTRSVALPNLIRPHLGNPLESKKAIDKMGKLTAGAPQLEENNLDQVAALPLGSRVKVNSWDDTLSLMTFKAVSKLSVQDKMPFEVAPMFQYLVHVE